MAKLNRQQKTPTKAEAFKKLTETEKELGELIQSLTLSLRNMEQELANMRKDMQSLDYRSLATLNALDAENVISRPIVESQLRKLQIKDFEEYSNNVNEQEGLEEVTTRASREHDVVVYELTAKDHEGLPLREYDVVRGRVKLGAQKVIPELESALTDVRPGRTSFFKFDAPSGQTIHYAVTIHQVLSAPEEEK